MDVVLGAHLDILKDDNLQTSIARGCFNNVLDGKLNFFQEIVYVTIRDVDLKLVLVQEKVMSASRNE